MDFRLSLRVGGDEGKMFLYFLWCGVVSGKECQIFIREINFIREANVVPFLSVYLRRW